MNLYAKKTDIAQYIRDINGRFFSIKFKKRTNGKIREMLCRTGVKCHLVPNAKPQYRQNFAQNDLIGVFDIQANAYRCIPIEGIEAIKINGKWVEAIS